MTSPTSNRRRFLKQGLGLSTIAALRPQLISAAPNVAGNTRAQWLAWVERVAEPVLHALSRRELRKSMPVEAVKGHEAERAVGSPLEALGRLLMGLAPWLELDPSPGEPAAETRLRLRYRTWAQEAIASAVDPRSPDYMRWGDSAQTLVDASFLALAILRAPKQLLDTMTASTRKGLTAALLAERKILTGHNNWVLFSALDEAMLYKLEAKWDHMRVGYALDKLSSWYVGDGTYGDGPHFHADNYNSYVMQPYLLILMQIVGDQESTWKSMRTEIEARAKRYAAIQERVIGPDGSFPVLGRSICYRAGAFHLLADASLRGLLPQHVSPAQVRCALTAVQQRTLDAPQTFDAAGWLRIGLAGHQPSLGETYISTGSLYLCSAAWLPLGLPATHPFWADSDAPWTQKIVWAGGDLTADHAMDA